MKTLPSNLSRRLILSGIFGTLIWGHLSVQAQINPVAANYNTFVKTNGEFVTIGNMLYKTNSPMNTEEFKHYMWRVQQVMQIVESGASNSTDKVVEGARALIKDYPHRPNGYEFIMMAIQDYEWGNKSSKARALAEELAAGSAPERFKLWAKGCLNRLNSYDKPVSIQFTALDGREVDLAKMKGKVALVDFWATSCGPCVAALPRVKAAYEKFHARGFEVIGISCDYDKERLERFISERGLPWPQFFDGQQQESNKFAQGFGIDGIPHMFLVDKKGFLRFDNVRANGEAAKFEDKISKLLAED